MTDKQAKSGDWFARIVGSPALVELERAAASAPQGLPVAMECSAGSSTTVVAAALHRRTKVPMLLVTAHRDEAEEVVAELRDLGVETRLFPAMESGGADQEGAEQFVERVAVLRELDGPGVAGVIVAPVTALMQGVPPRAAMESVARRIHTGLEVGRQSLLEWLVTAGYERVSSVEDPGSFAARGGIVDVHPVGAIAPVRIEYFGDTVERIFEVDSRTQAVDHEIESLELTRRGGADVADRDALIADRLASATILVLQDSAEIHEQARGYQDRLADGRGVWPWSDALKALHKHCSRTIEAGSSARAAVHERGVTLPVLPLAPFPEALPSAVDALVSLAEAASVVVLCDNEGECTRARELLAAHQAGKSIQIVEHHLHRGFHWDDESVGHLTLVPWHELLNRFGSRRRSVQQPTSSRARDAFLFFEPGDFVVHRDHGIALYRGLAPLPEGRSGGAQGEEFLTLEFHGGSTVHVPASRVSLIQRYVGAGSIKPPLSALGGRRWRRQKEEVEEAVRDLAASMMRVQAVRESTAGIAYPPDTHLQQEFEAEFPFQETEDQVTSIAAAKRDMERVRPMDRLVCGDVGFGKTEVAIRAAFKAVDGGKQVAILVPTTVLAEQHERTFKERMRAYPVRIESVSRFKTDREVNEVLGALAVGRVDIIIGTHRLLSRDVRFRDLGLVVIDEEQRFGVEHKQRLLEFRMTADVLTLTATPIPRTLHMAMLGLRDISSLTTPPPDRRAIVTEVIPWNLERLGGAIRRELAREGQVFWVHNRVHDIEEAAEAVQRLAPSARIAIGHGQMGDGELEAVMRRFMRHEADILVSTTIIESGIDIPTANTMIIDDAHRFGLSELHQLRGRVGRSSHRAYCYLLLPAKPIAPDAMKRLRALEDYSMLGAGFRIAVRDLEIRGAGNLLGSEQSGHIAAVGYEMYCQMLESAVHELKHDPLPVAIDTVVDLGYIGFIPKVFIASDRRRLEAYRRLADSPSLADFGKTIADLKSAYGDPPDPMARLFHLTELRLRATLAGIGSIRWLAPDVVIKTADPGVVHRKLKRLKGSVRTVGNPDESGLVDVYWRPETAQSAAEALVSALLRALAN